MAEFPVDPIVARMLLKSGEFQVCPVCQYFGPRLLIRQHLLRMQCSEEIATIVAMMQVQNIFYYPTRGQEAMKGSITVFKLYIHVYLLTLSIQIARNNQNNRIHF